MKVSIIGNCIVRARSRTTGRQTEIMGSLYKNLVAASAASIMISALALGASPNSEAPEHVQWRDAMINMETPHEGCFQAAFPSTLWESAPCRTLSLHAHPVHRTANPGQPQITGDGNDYALLAPGLITKTIGSFPSVVGVTSESSVGVPAFDNQGILGANEYTLQINTNAESKTSACSGGAAHCTVWQQFIYATDYETRGSAAVFMQYWLLDYGSSCPSGYNSSGSDCYKNSSYVAAPDAPITSLASLKMTATAIAGGNDSVTFANGTTAYSVSAVDSVLQIGTVWKDSEFNVVGDAGGSKAVFNADAKVTVNAAAQFGSTAAPTCEPNSGTTGETNNLNLGTCVAASGTTPSIQFTESGATVETCPSTVVKTGTKSGIDIDTGCQTTFSPAKLPGGQSVSSLVDIKYALGTTLYSGLYVSGFSSDPGSAWLFSASAEGVTKTSATATYSYSEGIAIWMWESQFGFPSSGSVSATIEHQ